MTLKNTHRENAMKKVMLKILGICLLISMGNVGFADDKKPRKDSRPNVLIFITDDESWLERSIYGWSNLQTPNFDKMAKSGVLFTRGYTSAPSCAPSRASLLTGKNFWELEQGAYIQAWLPAKFKRMPQLFEQAGYHTGYTGKCWGPGVKEPNMPEVSAGGTEYASVKRKDNEDGMSDNDYAGNLEAFLDANNEDKPFFFWMGIFEAHSPLGADNHKKLKEKYGIALDKVNIPEYLEDSEDLRKERAAIWYELCRVDEDLGRVIELLKKRGELENTIIFITGDNGTQTPFSKGSPYDWGVHVPYVISWQKGVKGGRIVDDFVNFIDIAPTVLEAANIKIPEEMSGRSLMNILKSNESGRVDPERSYMVTGLEWHGVLPPNRNTSRTIKDENYEYIVNYFRRTPSSLRPNCIELNNSGKIWEELYDSKNDKAYKHNLAYDPKYAEVKERMKKQLLEYQLKTKDPRATGDLKIFDETYAFVANRKKSGYAKGTSTPEGAAEYVKKMEEKKAADRAAAKKAKRESKK